MENSRKKQIAAAIQQELDDTGNSQNVWARQSNICKPATLSNILNGRWKNISDKMWASLEAYVMRYEWGFYKTINAQAIEAACLDAQHHSKFNTITGFNGAGKTTALYHYKKGHDKVYLLTCRSSFGAKDLAIRITQAIGIQTTGSRLIDIEDAIIKHLISTPNCLLVLDSVSKIRKDAALQFIGDLAEAKAVFSEIDF